MRSVKEFESACGLFQISYCVIHMERRIKARKTPRMLISIPVEIRTVCLLNAVPDSELSDYRYTEVFCFAPAADACFAVMV